ncbi:hypothetical protein OAO18_07005 [Francisellaceae bacterium]|nr:hypothetical protein [Francisellaceae bacterium]
MKKENLSPNAIKAEMEKSKPEHAKNITSKLIAHLAKLGISFLDPTWTSTSIETANTTETIASIASYKSNKNINLFSTYLDQYTETLLNSSHGHRYHFQNITTKDQAKKYIDLYHQVITKTIQQYHDVMIKANALFCSKILIKGIHDPDYENWDFYLHTLNSLTYKELAILFIAGDKNLTDKLPSESIEKIFNIYSGKTITILNELQKLDNNFLILHLNEELEAYGNSDTFNENDFEKLPTCEYAIPNKIRLSPVASKLISHVKELGSDAIFKEVISNTMLELGCTHRH